MIAEQELFYEHLMMRLKNVVKEIKEHEDMLKEPQKTLSFEEQSIKQFLTHSRKEVALLAKLIEQAGGSYVAIAKAINGVRSRRI